MTAYYVSDTIAPVTTASPAGGSFSGPITVSLTPNEPATTYYCTGSSSCTPTTVYSTPLKFSANTILRYYSRDVANNSESVRTQTYTIKTTPHASLTWTGYAVCLSCHSEEAMEMEASAHYRWEGEALHMVNGPDLQGKLKTAVNSYCGNIIGNWEAVRAAMLDWARDQMMQHSLSSSIWRTLIVSSVIRRITRGKRTLSQAL